MMKNKYTEAEKFLDKKFPNWRLELKLERQAELLDKLTSNMEEEIQIMLEMIKNLKGE